MILKIKERKKCPQMNVKTCMTNNKPSLSLLPLFALGASSSLAGQGWKTWFLKISPMLPFYR